MQEGVIVKSTGSWYNVRLKDDTVLKARIQGKFRLKGLKLTNPLAVGDRVMVNVEEGLETAMVVKILNRTNYIVRQSPRKKHFHHLIASNVDQVILVTTINYPMLKPGFIDRFLLMTAPFNIPTIIVFNKSDLYTEEDFMLFEGLKSIYESIGYTVYCVSSLNSENIEGLQEMLKGKVTLVGGHSGVGKSTLLNAIQPDLGLRTQDISDYSGKGQHTTTFAEMFSLTQGGHIIDTPGIKNLAFINMEPIDIAHNFLEFFERSNECKYSDCLHVNEPNCAVKEAVEKNEISELRYINYVGILEEVQDQNYWERNKEL